MRRKLLIILVLAAIGFLRLNAQDEYKVLENKWLEYSDASNSLYRHLTGQAFGMLRARTDTISNIRSVSDWQIRQAEIRKRLNRIIGPFPSKTDLNPRVERKIERDGFTVEHIIFESQPGYYVTSSLYLPSGIKNRERLPVIIYCSGHSAEGYRSAVYQHVILNLVNKRFIVFAYDPPGQGERLEYYNPEKGASIIGGPTREHSYPGAQAFLTGSSQAMFMVWDGIRAVDYLLTRKEVDPSRIGITGRSGGGTQSAYIAAFDERIYAAAPENYITNYTRLLQSIGPQDAEQNIPSIIDAGLDHPDLLLIRAPKPSLLITTINDMFSIQGARETENEVRRIYQAYGKGDNFFRIEDDAGHASTKKNREEMYRFFQLHLNNPGSNSDEEVIPLTPEEMKVTRTGQVSTSLNSETVFSINKKTATVFGEKLNSARNEKDYYEKALAAARKLSGYIEPLNDRDPVFAGRTLKSGYAIEKYFIKGEGDYVVPFLWFKPEEQSDKFLVIIHPDGKQSHSEPSGLAEELTLKGFNVISADLPGTGELGNGTLKGDAYIEGVSHNLWYASLIIGRSITAIQAGDLVRIANMIKIHNADARIFGYAYGHLMPVLFHAAAFSRSFTGLITEHSYTSYQSLIQNHFYSAVNMMSGVAGAVTCYDIPDLIASSGISGLMIIDPVDAKGGNDDIAGIETDMELMKKACSQIPGPAELRVEYSGKNGFTRQTLTEWIVKQTEK